MKFAHFSTVPETNRIPQDRDTAHRITTYGADNLYPQRMLQTLLLSPIAKSAVELTADFLRGDGFERGDMVLNEFGETANDILRLVAFDYAMYTGASYHLNSTGIGAVKEVRHIPFEFTRLGMANQKGQIKDCRVSNNWEQYDQTLPSPGELDDKRYLLFDQEQNGREALTTARGMVYYDTPQKVSYPLSSIDAIIETCQADHELAVYELGQISNGFLNLSVFKYPSGGNTEDEEEALREKLNALKGASNANSIIVASIDEDFEGSGPLIEQIPANNGDGLFINMTLNVKNRIAQNFALPSSLLGTQPNGSFINSQQLADDYTYMNLRTRDRRNHIARVFNERFGLNVGKIIPNQFESSIMQPLTPGTNGN